MANIYAQEQAISSLSGGKQCPIGTHKAICVQIVDQGTKEGAYGTYYSYRFVFEVKDKQDPENPYLIAEQFILGLHPKSPLRKMLASWRGRDFNAQEISDYNKNIDLLFKNVVGKGCMISVVAVNRGDKTYHNVNAVLNLDKEDWFEPVTPIVFFSIQNDFPINKENQEQLKMLPEWVQQQTLEKNEVIRLVYKEYNMQIPTWEQWSGNTESSEPRASEPVINDDIPF